MTATTTRASGHNRAAPGSANSARPAGTPAPIPLRRIVAVELRKSVDTRAGFWLLSSIGITSMLAIGMVIVFASAAELAYSTFTLAIGFPMSVILPIVAILSVTAEWSQRSGLTTFTLAPRRGRIVLAKAAAALAIAVVSTLLIFSIGAAGNLLSSTLAGVPTTWDQEGTDVLYLMVANILLLLVGFTLGVLIRGSTGAIVAYFIYAFVAPTLLTFLAIRQDWFRDLQPWVDLNYNQTALPSGGFSTDQWTQLAVTTTVWLLLPMLVGVRNLMRAEVK